ncbi:FecCD family ABC transporter permease [Methanoplanus limicola]|uniref:Cobalamin import system permease protein BtuC n=1 Tax=Methanoplanus limicola DSM 2279 TaxID=937775 RepID=H1Z246_9EURY|nr:iron ABC transporter permease [Methanoplanus limicola]EHQ36391.1 ABC-type transporter, integral membrane subunit [Methanoplanus limicola DSM 2279]
MEEISKGRYLKFIRKKIFFLLAIIIALVIVMGVSVTIGSYDMTIADVYSIIIYGILNPGTSTADLVVWNVRLPRILMGLLAGIGLGISGTVLQAVLKNPLASPFTLGISTSATFGASLAIILGAGIVGGSYIVVINAFIFTLISSFAIYSLAYAKRFTAGAIIMAGIAISYLFGAMTSFIQFIGTADALQQLVFWTMGSLGKANWLSIEIVTLILVVTIPVIMWYSMDLNVMGSGDEAAKSMGVDITRVRIVTMVLTALITAGIICFTGTIGFIGLVGPHICRMIIGADHRFLIPASGLMGGLILISADAFARAVFAPLVIPIGIMTAFIGVPFFIYLFIRRRGTFW